MRKINSTNIISVFECFSSEVRFNIFRLLSNYGSEGLIAGDIAEKLKLPVNNLSFHLKTLRQAKIISMKQEGRFLRYRANKYLISELINFFEKEK